jgi:hypothetical protein
MRHAWLALALLLALPSLAHAQAHVVVIVPVEGPLRALLDIELAARGLSARFAAPGAESSACVVDPDAVGALVIETTGGTTIHAYGRACDASAAWHQDGEADARVLAVVSATMLEDLLAATLPEAEVASAPLVVAPPRDVRVAAPDEEPAAPPSFRVPHLGLFTGVDIGAWIGLVPGVEANASARTSLGLQWAGGFRIGVVGQLDGYGLSEATASSYRAQPAVGIEVGGRFGDTLFAFHVGAHALLGLGHPRSALGEQPLTGILGGYLGAGLWVDPRVELGLRVQAEAWIEDGRSFPILRVLARCEWR